MQTSCASLSNIIFSQINLFLLKLQHLIHKFLCLFYIIIIYLSFVYFHTSSFQIDLFSIFGTQILISDKKVSGKSKDEQMAEKKQELERRLQDVTGVLGSNKKPSKKGAFFIPFNFFCLNSFNYCSSSNFLIKTKSKIFQFRRSNKSGCKRRPQFVKQQYV